MHQSSGGQPTEYRGGGWIFQLGEDYERKVQMHQLAKQPKGLEMLPAKKVDEINRAFLKLNSLKAEHRASLLQAGVPLEGIGSLDQRRAEEIAQALLAQFGGETTRLHPLLRSLPSKASTTHSWTIAGAVGNGMLFPAVSVDGLILGIQLRLDHPPSGEERYRWLSSAGKGGTPLTVFRAKTDCSPHPHSKLEPLRRSGSAKSLEVVPDQQGNEGSGMTPTNENSSACVVRITPEYRWETLLVTEGYKKAAVINQQWVVQRSAWRELALTTEKNWCEQFSGWLPSG
jgi:hypothetical protein